jgi:hypothetical protein
MIISVTFFSIPALEAVRAANAKKKEKKRVNNEKGNINRDAANCDRFDRIRRDRREDLSGSFSDSRLGYSNVSHRKN